MSDANLEVVRRTFDAVQGRDIDTLLSYCAPEIEYESLLTQVEGGQLYRGHAGVRRFFSDMFGVWEVWFPEPEHVEGAGDAVLVTGRSRLRGAGSGLELSLEWGQVLRLRDGKVVWAKLYSDQALARAEFEAMPAQ